LDFDLVAASGLWIIGYADRTDTDLSTSDRGETNARWPAAEFAPCAWHYDHSRSTRRRVNGYSCPKDHSLPKGYTLRVLAGSIVVQWRSAQGTPQGS
jgi:hypothetical protein